MAESIKQKPARLAGPGLPDFRNLGVMLRVLLVQHFREVEEAKRAERAAEKRKIEWGSQIRSYVLDDRRVKDTRTGVETSNTEAVLDGDIKPFIHAYLLSNGGQQA